MKYGIECRLPFLNTQLVETASKSCPKMLYGMVNLDQRLYYKKHLENLLPDEIIDRKKLAFQDGMGIKESIFKHN